MNSHIPSLLEKEWTLKEIAAADAFMQAMGDNPAIFATGKGCGRLMHCIRAALIAAKGT